jgi:hypothetical protein
MRLREAKIFPSIIQLEQGRARIEKNSLTPEPSFAQDASLPIHAAPLLGTYSTRPGPWSCCGVGHLFSLDPVLNHSQRNSSTLPTKAGIDSPSFIGTSESQ